MKTRARAICIFIAVNISFLLLLAGGTQSISAQGPLPSKSPLPPPPIKPVDHSVQRKRPVSATGDAFTVSASGQWVNTGLVFNVGDQLVISASGSWCPGSQSACPVGPDGSSTAWPDNFLNLADIGVCAYCATTNVPHWAALVGYIGSAPPPAGSYISTNVITEAQKVFAVGSSYNGTAGNAGTLWLNFNDDAYSNNTADNTGQVTATVSGSHTGSNHLPIVFVTGWNGMFPDPSCRQANPQQDWQIESNDITNDGHEVYYAVLNSSWCYTPPLETNAAILRDRIDFAKNETGQPKVILIAHSMGGIVSRAYVEGSTYQNDVDSLFTLGSPHLGIPAQAFALFSFYGAIDHGTYFARQPVAEELSGVGMWIFNEFHFTRNGVNYHLIGGDAPDSSRNTLGLVAEWINPRPNDVGVATDSALADGLSGAIDRMTTDEVHASMVGPRDYFVYDGGLSNSYLNCIRPNLIGSSPVSCGAVGPSNPTRRSSSVNLTSSMSPIYTGTIQSGQYLYVPIELEGGPALFASTWQRGTVAVTLVDPNGLTIDPAYATANPTVVRYSAAGTLASYDFADALPGSESVLAHGASVPTGGTFVASLAAANTGVNLTGRTDQLWYSPGATAVISATLAGSDSAPEITAIVSRADGITQTVSLAPVGGGQYRGTYVIPDSPGYASVFLMAQGVSAGGTPFKKATNVLFQIASSLGSFTGSYSDAPQARSTSSSLYAALQVNVGISSPTGGQVGLTADITDMAGNFVAHSSTISTVPPGASTLSLSFDGDEIFQSQRDGPYRLTNLLLTDERGVSLVVSYIMNAYTTSTYSFRSFASQTAYFLPLVLK
ncbi:MAG: alpha/beta fold hydrolase [Chloroflexi bacterium]|nr:alpha/beta fold hydrolase [Chloroflexota bacterium]